MSCPEIYIGTGRFATSLAADTANDGILTPSPNLTVNVPVTVQVVVNNHGTDAAPKTSIELSWTDPTTGYSAPIANRISEYSFATGEIPGAVTVPPSEGMIPHNFGWTPSAEVLQTNGGHVCILARLSNTEAPTGACLSQSYGADPTRDPLSAIHCLQIVGTGDAGGAGGTGGGAGTGGAGGAGGGAGTENTGRAGESGAADTAGGNTGDGGVAGASDSSAGAPGGGSPHESGGGGGGVGAMGAGGASASTSGSVSAAGTSSHSAPPSDSGCGCRLNRSDHLTTSALFAGLALFAVFKWRRANNPLRRPRPRDGGT